MACESFVTESLPVGIAPFLSLLEYKLIRTQPNGNCLFESIHHILKSIGQTRSVATLRQIVANSILDETNKEANDALQFWHSLVQTTSDNSVEQLHVRHMLSVKHKPWPLTREDRQQVALAMLRPDYWGDEYCIRLFESGLKCRLCVFWFDPHSLELGVNHLSRETPLETEYVAFLWHNVGVAHYQPLIFSPVASFVFLWQNLPKQLHELLTKLGVSVDQ